MDEIIKISKKHSRRDIDWKNIKITFVISKRNRCNSLNPNGRLNREERKNRLIELSANILRTSPL